MVQVVLKQTTAVTLYRAKTQWFCLTEAGGSQPGTRWPAGLPQRPRVFCTVENKNILPVTMTSATQEPPAPHLAPELSCPGLFANAGLFLSTDHPVSWSSFCLHTERTFPPSLPMQTWCMFLSKALILQSSAPRSSCPLVLIPQTLAHGTVKWVRRMLL